MSTSITVIGAGLAGLSATLTAAEKGIPVQLVSDGPSERAQSVMAEGGLNAALNTKGENDSVAEHFRDTMIAACGLADPQAVEGLVRAAPAIVRRLLSLGVQFNMSGLGEVDLRNFGGQRKKRTVHAQSDTGKQIMTALIDEVRKHEVAGRVRRYPHHVFETLLWGGSACSGCVIRDVYTGMSELLTSSAVIIATGGMHGLFGDTTGSLGNTATVTAELFRLGLPLANSEFIQYHPTTVAYNGKRLLISEAARGEGARLCVLHKGAPQFFMEEKYPELGNLMPRDIVSREVWEQEKTAQVFLDMREIPAKVMEEKLSGLINDCKTFLRIDPQKELLPISPGIHYFMGGILVDKRHRTAISQLYAAGECCCQYHGANRLGGNSLLGALYGGMTAVQDAAETLAETTKKFEAYDSPPAMMLSPDRLHTLNRTMSKALSIVRDEKTLTEGLAALEDMPGVLPLLGRAVLSSALARTESRGAHMRSDFPERDDKRFLRTTVAQFDGSNIAVDFEEIPKKL